QSNADITSRVRKLVRRGVRRVFAIHVGDDEDGELRAGPVKEWMAAEDRWRELPPDEDITDRCLMQPIKVQALLDATEAKNQAARALLAQGNAVIAADRHKALEAQKRTLTRAYRKELEARDAELRARDAELQARDARERET